MMIMIFVMILMLLIMMMMMMDEHDNSPKTGARSVRPNHRLDRARSNTCLKIEICTKIKTQNIACFKLNFNTCRCLNSITRLLLNQQNACSTAPPFGRVYFPSCPFDLDTINKVRTDVSIHLEAYNMEEYWNETKKHCKSNCSKRESERAVCGEWCTGKEGLPPSFLSLRPFFSYKKDVKFRSEKFKSFVHNDEKLQQRSIKDISSINCSCAKHMCL